jgi:hypothetical protein
VMSGVEAPSMLAIRILVFTFYIFV